MIDVLVATYNGEKYLAEQLDSVLKQTYTEFRILIRDDGSTDGTVDIIEKYAEAYPDKIVYVKDDMKCGSAVSNFMQLSNYSDADYIMYCDQDDYWLPHKIQVTLDKMSDIERKLGKDKPILVFSTYKPVDENLSEYDYKENSTQIAAYNLQLNRLIVQNYVTGCLMMVNRKLLKLAGEYSDEIMMHDWWFSLIASAMGKIEHIDDVTTLYRQHTDNEVGVVNVKSFSYRISKIFDKETRNRKYMNRNQMQLFLARYKDALDSESYKIVEDFLLMYEEKSKLKRMRALIKGKYLKSDVIRIIGQLWYI